MKLHKKKIAVLAAALAVVGVMTVAAEAVVHTTVLSGKVTKVLPAGTAVKEGEVLVEVESLAGSMPAARATVDGTVATTETEVGADVKKGDEVAVVETE